MAKLYWRIKKNGKWTWTPASLQIMMLAEQLGFQEEE